MHPLPFALLTNIFYLLLVYYRIIDPPRRLRGSVAGGSALSVEECAVGEPGAVAALSVGMSDVVAH